jgi:hypothetical protein
MDRSDSMVAVDELLAVTETYRPEADPDRPTVVPEIPVHVEGEEEEVHTGVYDVSFFQGHSVPPVEQRKTGLEFLEDARIGMGLFLDEAEGALHTPDLTVDQRLHVATIITYIEGLAKRFDVIREPGFVRPKRRRTGT